MADKDFTGGTNYSQTNAAGNYRSSNQMALTSGPMLEPAHSDQWPGWQDWFNRLYQRLMSDTAISYAMTVFLTHRLLLFAVGALFAIILPLEPSLGSSLLQNVNPRFWGPGLFFLAPWQRWDTNWYIRIAQAGYDVGNGTTNFPPLYPVLVGITGRLLVGQYMLAALVVANLAYLVSLVYLYRLTDKYFGEGVARKTLLFTATFPTAFFLACGYTESLYLALTLAAFYYGEKRRWYLAALLAALAGITRIQGIVLIVPLGYLYLQQQGFNWRKLGREGLALALAPGLFGLYMFWVYFGLRDQNFSNHLSVIWHIKFVMPWESFFGGLFGMFDRYHIKGIFYNSSDFVILCLFIALTIIWWQRNLPRHYLIYSALSLLVFLTRQGTEDIFWMSINRYVIVLFPAFMLMGLTASRKWLKWSAVLQGFWVIMFIFWMWAG
jgi:hypothetical protein